MFDAAEPVTTSSGMKDAFTWDTQHQRTRGDKVAPAYHRLSSVHHLQSSQVRVVCCSSRASRSVLPALALTLECSHRLSSTMDEPRPRLDTIPVPARSLPQSPPRSCTSPKPRLKQQDRLHARVVLGVARGHPRHHRRLAPSQRAARLVAPSLCMHNPHQAASQSCLVAAMAVEPPRSVFIDHQLLPRCRVRQVEGVALPQGGRLEQARCRVGGWWQRTPSMQQAKDHQRAREDASVLTQSRTLVAATLQASDLSLTSPFGCTKVYQWLRLKRWLWCYYSAWSCVTTPRLLLLRQQQCRNVFTQPHTHAATSRARSSTVSALYRIHTLQEAS